MLRFVVKVTDYAPFAGGGEDPIVELVTVDVEVPELERVLNGNPRNLIRAQLLGIEKLTESHFADKLSK
jgi:hypothetical protein